MEDVLSEKQQVLVTGGTRGIGLACARRMLRDGFEVIVVGKSEKSVDRALAFLNTPERTIGWVCDLSNATGLELLKEKLSETDNLTKVIHAIGGSLGVTANSSVDSWQAVHWLNFIIPVEINKVLLAETRGQRPGRILHISSSAAIHGRASLPYVCAKAALNAYVRAEGNRLAAGEIALGAIMPAAVSGLENVWERVKVADKERWDRVLSGQALGRFQTPEEIASFASWYCGTEGAIFSGQCLSADPVA